MERLDEVDRRIIVAVQKDARRPLKFLGRESGVSKEVAAYRLRRLERLRVIEGYHARVNRARVGRGLTVVIRVRCTNVREAEAEAATRIARIPGITSVFRVFGPDDLIVIARCIDVDDAKELLYHRLREVKYVRMTNSTIVHTEVKDSTFVDPHPICFSNHLPRRRSHG